MRKTKIIIAIIVAITFANIVYVLFFKQEIFFRPTETTIPEGISSELVQEDTEPNIEIVAENLNIPWDIVFLPNGEILIPERSGNLLEIGESERSIPLEGVQHVGEGGLLGLVLHPDFAQNQFLYLYLTTKTDSGLSNRVDRYRYDGNELSDRQIIIENIPGATHHDGGRMAFGPDGYLYITSGDAGQSELAQDLDSLSGKLLRLNDDGSIPEDNPFGTAVYSYGHRNSQGIAWDDQGRLWSTEHGRSGIKSGFDELNLIEKGKNYGWPVIQGDETQEGMEAPVVQSGPDDTWAPADALYLNGSIFFTGLRGESLYQAKINSDGEVTSLSSHFRGEFGRLRAMEIGPDGHLYLTTSNTDGRGIVQKSDDKLIRINPSIFD